MAGGGSLGGDSGGRSRRGKSSKRKKKKRVGYHLDMTPLVDITFLLLTFFMFTTKMATPQIMEMKVPPESDVPVEVAQSKLLSVIVDSDGDIFYYTGVEEAKPIEMKELRKMAIKLNLEQLNELITVLKVSDDVDYGIVIKVLDELNLAESGIIEEMSAKRGQFERKRKFTIAGMTEEDFEKISQFNENGQPEGEENDG